MPTERDTYVDRPGKPRVYVKNLGWLRKHWQEVAEFKVTHAHGTRGACYLVAVLKDGGQYHTTWASTILLFDWLVRPVFKGVLVTFSGFHPSIGLSKIAYSIGSPEYMRLRSDVRP